MEHEKTKRARRSPVEDVRMRGFRERREVAEVLAMLRKAVQFQLAEPGEEPERIDVAAASDRVLASDLRAPIDVPGFRRSAVDGYAVRAEDTFAATLSAPVELRLRGQSMPGRPCEIRVGAGEAVRITTGAPVPAGADAVLQAELCRESTYQGQASVLALGAVAPLRHIGQVGEDVSKDSIVLRAGQRLRPQDAGIIASLGIAQVPIIRRPRVLVLVTGDELVAAGESPGPYQIVDSNSITLAGLCARDRAEVLPVLRSRDGADNLRAALSTAQASDADVILTCGATSVGCEDWLPLLVAERGELLVHGIAMRPSSPTGIGRLDDGRWVFLLPGNPVSCLCAYEFFVGPLLRALGRRPNPWRWPHRRLRLPLARKIVSKIGRFDFVRVVRVVQVTDPANPSDSGQATDLTLPTEHLDPKSALIPVATSGASLLSSTVIADGVVLVPPESEGHNVGEIVEMLAFEESTP